jgi:hypothetical protein
LKAPQHIWQLSTKYLELSLLPARITTFSNKQVGEVSEIFHVHSQSPLQRRAGNHEIYFLTRAIRWSADMKMSLF